MLNISTPRSALRTQTMLASQEVQDDSADSSSPVPTTGNFSSAQRLSPPLSISWYVCVLLLYLGLAGYNLGLPGLHYDEAKEAGLNAMELLTGQPVTPFRDAGVMVGGLHLPLMVQDYIGATNVYLSLPILKLTGIGVPNLRFVSLFAGLAALIMLERTISNWVLLHSGRSVRRTRITVAGLIGMSLVAASPSFVFWSRQGIFVTNVIQPLSFGFMWMGLAWLRTARITYLLLSGLLAGLALYGKLLAIWIVLPFALYMFFRSLCSEHHQGRFVQRLLVRWSLFGLMGLLPLLPFLYFNWQTEGTLTALLTNAGESYYGVDNSAIWANASVRWSQLVDVLQGNQFWYLGGTYANQLAPWLMLITIITGLIIRPRLLAQWLLIVGGAFLLSLFTISDLFITHYALLHPLLLGSAALGLVSLWSPRLLSPSGQENLDAVHDPASPISIVAPRMRVVIAAAVVVLWVLGDIFATARYHRVLGQTGGLADHSDTSYTLAYHLRYNGMGAPILLDWGMDAPIRYLTEGTVRPIEIFGYDSPVAPDDDFLNRLDLFLDNPDNVYLLHSPGTTVFAGRRELFFEEVASRTLQADLAETFVQRDGTPLFELWRVR